MFLILVSIAIAASTASSAKAVCVTLYDPVCCTAVNNTVTEIDYSNTCLAQLDGCSTWTAGECNPTVKSSGLKILAIVGLIYIAWKFGTGIKK